MADTRRKNVSWGLPQHGLEWHHAQIAVLMDIRDELQSINAKLNCYRIPRALDALHEVGVDIRRKQRAARKKAQAKKKKA